MCVIFLRIICLLRVDQQDRVRRIRVVFIIRLWYTYSVKCITGVGILYYYVVHIIDVNVKMIKRLLTTKIVRNWSEKIVLFNIAFTYYKKILFVYFLKVLINYYWLSVHGLPPRISYIPFRDYRFTGDDNNNNNIQLYCLRLTRAGDVILHLENHILRLL